jgi:PPOX class probable FMN-dependent enzyme
MALFAAAGADQNRRMPQTIWQPSLVLAFYLNRQAPSSRFVQLATVRAGGRPANRTLMFGGFLGETAQLTFHTDARSSKVVELADCPWAEACWYFPVTHEQFRIAGTVTMVGHDAADAALVDARRAAWRELPDPTRVSYIWPAPGAPRIHAVPFPTEHPNPAEPVAEFCVLVLDPQAVDYLEINGNPQNRWQYQRDENGRWSGTEINP